jgi:hypothetical protein
MNKYLVFSSLIIIIGVQSLTNLKIKFAFKL